MQAQRISRWRAHGVELRWNAVHRESGKYSDVAKALIADIGVKTGKFYKAYDAKLYSKMGTAAFFDKGTFGEEPPGYWHECDSLAGIPC